MVVQDSPYKEEIAVEVFDTIRSKRMGEDMGYMGFFQNLESALAYINGHWHLMESIPYIKIWNRQEYTPKGFT